MRWFSVPAGLLVVSIALSCVAGFAAGASIASILADDNGIPYWEVQGALFDRRGKASESDTSANSNACGGQASDAAQLGNASKPFWAEVPTSLTWAGNTTVSFFAGINQEGIPLVSSRGPDGTHDLEDIFDNCLYVWAGQSAIGLQPSQLDKLTCNFDVSFSGRNGYHATIVIRDSFWVQIYLNGQLCSEAVLSQPSHVCLPGKIAIAQDYNGNFPLVGWIRDVRLYSQALLPEQVYHLHKSCRGAFVGHDVGSSCLQGYRERQGGSSSCSAVDCPVACSDEPLCAPPLELLKPGPSNSLSIGFATSDNSSVVLSNLLGFNTNSLSLDVLLKRCQTTPSFNVSGEAVWAAVPAGRRLVHLATPECPSTVLEPRSDVRVLHNASFDFNGTAFAKTLASTQYTVYFWTKNLADEQLVVFFYHNLTYASQRRACFEVQDQVLYVYGPDGQFAKYGNVRPFGENSVPQEDFTNKWSMRAISVNGSHTTYFVDGKHAQVDMVPFCPDIEAIFPAAGPDVGVVYSSLRFLPEAMSVQQLQQTYYTEGQEFNYHLCPAGDYRDTITQLCTPCDFHTISQSPGQLQCDKCPAGTQQESKGMTACDECTRGKFSPEDGVACVNCGKGTSSDDSAATWCNACQPGFVASISGQTSCMPCEAGQFQALAQQATCSACRPGTYSAASGASQCELCPYHSYQDSSAASECFSCPQGKITLQTGSDSLSACVRACSAGQYHDGQNASVCKPCSPGTTSLEGSNSCTLCTQGFYLQRLNDSSKCVPCPFGSTTKLPSNGGISDCGCLSGRYKDQNGLCAPCPRFSTSKFGSEGKDQCACSPSFPGVQAGSDPNVGDGCGCAEGYYMDHVKQACTGCGLGYDCEWSGNWSRSIATPEILPGYWSTWSFPHSSDSMPTQDHLMLTYLDAEARNFSSHQVQVCYSANTCVGNNNCADGRTGIACTFCVPGRYGGPDGGCTECTSSPDEQRQLLIMSTLLMGPLALLAFKTFGLSASTDAKGAFDAFKSLRVSSQQLVKFLQQLNVISGFSISWPPEVLALYSSLGIFKLDMSGPMAVGCLASSQTIGLVMSSKWLTPIVLVLCSVLAMLLSQVLGRSLALIPKPKAAQWAKRVKFGWAESARLIYAVFALFAASTISDSLIMLTCKSNPNGKLTVQDYPAVECGSNEFWQYAAWSMLAFLVYAFGYLVLTVQVIRQVLRWQANDPDDRGPWAFVTDPFRDSQVYWPVCMVTRDISLNLPVVMFPADGGNQLIVSAFVMLAYAICTLLMNPFVDWSNNILEVLLSLCAFTQLVVAAGSGYQTESDMTGRTDSMAIWYMGLMYFSVVVPVIFLVSQFLSGFESVQRRLPPALKDVSYDDRDAQITMLQQVFERRGLANVLHGLDAHELRSIMWTFRTSGRASTSFRPQERTLMKSPSFRISEHHTVSLEAEKDEVLRDSADLDCEKQAEAKTTEILECPVAKEWEIPHALRSA